MSCNPLKVIYSINNADLQDVAMDVLNRKLTEDELKKVGNRLGDFVDWRQSIYNAIEMSVGITENVTS
jgi:hypothetical protein